jgi:hypothetical protein
MTEDDWLSATDPRPMLDSLHTRGGASERKLRLFTVACGRRYRVLLDCYTRDPGGEEGAGARLCDEILDAAERQADGAGSPKQLLMLQLQLGQQPTELLWTLGDILRGDTTPWGRLCEDRSAPVREEAGVDLDDLRRFLTGLLRCVFGNPFRPAPSLAPAVVSWNGSTVPKLAAAIYGERAFDRLPVLADALEDAGCTDAAILGHCRMGGEHARGCWVVDLVLGKG